MKTFNYRSHPFESLQIFQTLQSALQLGLNIVVLCGHVLQPLLKFRPFLVKLLGFAFVLFGLELHVACSVVKKKRSETVS